MSGKTVDGLMEAVSRYADAKGGKGNLHARAQLYRAIRTYAEALAAPQEQPAVTVAFVDKDQPNGIAWRPGYPEGLPDITPLGAIAAKEQPAGDVAAPPGVQEDGNV